MERNVMFDSLLEKVLKIMETQAIAAWLLPNGRLKELSSYFMGNHGKDAFVFLYPEKKIPKDDDEAQDAFAEAQFEYIGLGNIRFNFGLGEVNVEIGRKPTESQIRTIGKYVRESDSFFFTINSGKESWEGSTWSEFRKIVGGLKTA